MRYLCCGERVGRQCVCRGKREGGNKGHCVTHKGQSDAFFEQKGVGSEYGSQEEKWGNCDEVLMR